MKVRGMLIFRLSADVKPTNVLVNRKGEVKLCDFGVSGLLEKSLAKTHVGAQSYMAPERIDAGGPDGHGAAGKYTVAADVWSLGITALEMAQGKFPYTSPPHAGALAQLIAIVNGPSPQLPAESFSEMAQNWVARCLEKAPERRATYAELLVSIPRVCCNFSKAISSNWISKAHPFLSDEQLGHVDVARWVVQAMGDANTSMDVSV
jgi:mitogen-activated protein kinase kinase